MRLQVKVLWCKSTISFLHFKKVKIYLMKKKRRRERERITQIYQRDSFIKWNNLWVDLDRPSVWYKIELSGHQDARPTTHLHPVMANLFYFNLLSLMAIINRKRSQVLVFLTLLDFWPTGETVIYLHVK